MCETGPTQSQRLQPGKMMLLATLKKKSYNVRCNTSSKLTLHSGCLANYVCGPTWPGMAWHSCWYGYDTMACFNPEQMGRKRYHRIFCATTAYFKPEQIDFKTHLLNSRLP